MTSWLIAALCALPVLALAADAPEHTTVRPRDTGAALCNPGMGWVFHHYDNVVRHYGSRLEPSDTLDDWPGLTVIYLRLAWSYLEPEEGKFHWAVLDGPAQRWVAKGKQIALRISCCESFLRYATPEWVQKAGAKGVDFRPGKGVEKDGPYWEPAYDDPVFLDKLDRFLAALAARYDGRAEVAFIDVGSYGVWGEGHTYASSRLQVSPATRRKHIDLHARHFKRTLLAINDDFVSQGGGQETIDYAREKGMTLRDDSILVQPGKRAYFHAEMAQPFWPRVPVVLESEHYGGSKQRGNWRDGRLYLQAVEDYHASYASIHWWPREFLDANRELVRRINLRLGYRLQLVEATWPRVARAQSAWRFAATWRNAGVAPCLPGGRVAVTLKDAKGGIAAVFVDQGLDVRSLPVGAPGKAEARSHDAAFTLPFYLKPGDYGLWVSVGTATGTPRIALPLPDGDGERRYRLGSLAVTGDYGVAVGKLSRRGGKWLLPCTWTVHLRQPAGARPFCHLDRGSKIAFQALPDADVDWRQLGKPGVVACGCLFDVPESARGGSYPVRLGLWVPTRIGRTDERRLPDRGEMDRRVTVGTLEIAADGTPSFSPLP